MIVPVYSAQICQNTNHSQRNRTNWQVLWEASEQKYKHGNSNKESLPLHSCAIWGKKKCQSSAFTSGLLHDIQSWELLCDTYLNDVEDNILVEAVQDTLGYTVVIPGSMDEQQIL